MDPKSPFANAVPIIGQPVIFSGLVLIGLSCTCEAKQAMIVLAGQPTACPACKKQWLAQAKIEANVQHFVPTRADES